MSSPDHPEVWGVLKAPGSERALNPGIRAIVCDLCVSKDVEDLLKEVRPDRIYHLAGQAFVPQSWTDPWGTLETNLRAQLNVLDRSVALKLLGTRILVVGSEEEYGASHAFGTPVREDAPVLPETPYGVSKVGQDFLGRAFFTRYGLPVIRVRPFNHIGPGQDRRFVASDFAHQIAAIERGLGPLTLCVGNLEASRDFTDVRDVARAYVAALERGEPGEVYNIASGVLTTIRFLLDGLLAHATCPITVVQDPSRYRPAEKPRSPGDFSSLQALTGWSPRIPFDQTLRDILTYEREHCS